LLVVERSLAAETCPASYQGKRNAGALLLARPEAFSITEKEQI